MRGRRSDVAIGRIRAATELVAQKAPEDLEDWQHLLVNVAQAMAEEVDGVSDKESEAVARVRDAVGLTPAAPADTAEESAPAGDGEPAAEEAARPAEPVEAAAPSQVPAE